MKEIRKYRYTIFFILAVSLSVFLTVISLDLVVEKDKAVDLIVTMLSILSGLIIAVIVLIGDPILLPEGEWSDAELKRPALESKLAKYQALFVLYIVTLISIFTSRILTDSLDTDTHNWINFSMVFLIYLSLCYSLLLPRTLISLLKNKHNEYTNLLRKKAGFKD